MSTTRRSRRPGIGWLGEALQGPCSNRDPGSNIGRILVSAPYTVTELNVLDASYNATEGLSTGITAIAAGPDGNLWFTETGDWTIGRISPHGSNAISRFPSKDCQRASGRYRRRT